MSDKKLKTQLVKLAYNNPELREDLLPLLKEAQQDRIASALDDFQEAASDFASSHLTELDYDTQKDLMQAISKVHRGGNLKNPKGLLRSLMKDRQNIQGRPGTILDRMIHALEEMGTRTSSLSRQSKGDTFKCPECGTKVMEKTKYCVKCEKKVKKESSTKTARLKIKEYDGGYSFSIEDWSWEEPNLWKVDGQAVYADSFRELKKIVNKALRKPLPERAWKDVQGLIRGGNTAKISYVPEQFTVYN